MTSKPPEKPDAPATNGTVHGELLAFARKVLGANALGFLLLLAVLVFAALYGREVLAQDTAREVTVQTAEVRAQVAALARQQREDEALHAEQMRKQADVEKRMANVERLTTQTDANVTLLVKANGMRPVRIDVEDLDGGR